MAHDKEFKEVGHSGGKITFIIVTDTDGKKKFQIRWEHQRIGPAALFAVYALQGTAVGGIELGGIGAPWNPPPHPNCVPVFIASDSEGMFGHRCYACGQYWRSDGSSTHCPYCLATGDKHMFLTDAQCRYIEQYCETLSASLASGKDGSYVIDMDAVADAVGDVAKPDFYYAEESQQKKFRCEACGTLVDILGRYCFCPRCATRNDLTELKSTLDALRKRINTSGDYEAGVTDAVGAFDTLVGNLIRQLVILVPLTGGRKARLEGRFHNLATVAANLKTIFDINILENISADDAAFATRLFFRRHVYEHLGGVVDQRYIDDSGDISVRLGQSIRENQEGTNRFIGIVARMAENLQDGFHELLPPIKEPIEWFSKTGARRGVESP